MSLMNYQGLGDEMNTYKTVSAQLENTLSKLSFFMKTLSEYGILFADNSQKALDEFYTELSKENQNITLNISLSNLCQNYKVFFNNFRDNYNNIKNTLCTKIDKYIPELKKFNEETESNFNSIIYKFHENKIILEKSKLYYFETCEIEEKRKKDDKNASSNIQKIPGNPVYF